MRNVLKSFLEKILTVPVIKLARKWPSLPLIIAVRLLNGIQMTARQMQLIMKTIQKKTPCKFLVFGVGNDSVFWALLNQGGETVFLEDNPVWFDKITKRIPQISAYLISYETLRKDWKKLLAEPSLLEVSLPESIKEQDWDIALVDAPAGYDDNTPGRMKSIYTASKLVRDSGDVFVHDCNREVEDLFCNNFLKKENLSFEIKSPIGHLRQYHIKSR